MKNRLFYAGLNKDEFEALMDEAVRENAHNLKLYSLITTVLFIILAISNIVMNDLALDNRLFYTSMAILNGAIYVCAVLILPNNPKATMPLAYTFILLLYGYSLGVTLRHPEYPALTAIAVMLMIPFLFADRPIYNILLTVIAVAALCLFSGRFKTPAIARDDIWNALSFGAVSIAAIMMNMGIKFRTLSQARRIKYLSETDLLTGVKNRNLYEEMLEACGPRCPQPMTCVYVDVNGLHELNDTKGHAAGDVMLQTVAKALIDRFGTDHIYRIGGDEFVILSPELNAEAARTSLNCAQEELSRQGYDISVGVATGATGSEVSELITNAEQEMYEAKSAYYRQRGKDRRRR